MSNDDLAGGGPGSEIIEAANRAIRAITALPRPVVAVVHGPAAGVGVSLALACDLVLASEKSFFMLAFTQVGLMPDGGASALIAAAVGRIRAMRMALLAERLPAAEALSWVWPPRSIRLKTSKPRSTRWFRNWLRVPLWHTLRPRTRSTRPR
jgi:enoyl-CoA hydratase